MASSPITSWQTDGETMETVTVHRVAQSRTQLKRLSSSSSNLNHEKLWLDEAQAGIKTARRNINNLRYADDTTLMAESEKELKSLLMKVKEESENLA